MPRMRAIGGKPSQWLMRRERGTRALSTWCAARFAARVPSTLPSRQERRPGRIRRVAGRRNLLLVAAGEIDGVERGPGVAAGIAEEHQHAAVRREGRALVVEARGEDALARAVRIDHADGELAAELLGEGDHVAAR